MTHKKTNGEERQQVSVLLVNQQKNVLLYTILSKKRNATCEKI